MLQTNKIFNFIIYKYYLNIVVNHLIYYKIITILIKSNKVFKKNKLLFI